MHKSGDRGGLVSYNTKNNVCLCRFSRDMRKAKSSLYKAGAEKTRKTEIRLEIEMCASP